MWKTGPLGEDLKNISAYINTGKKKSPCDIELEDWKSADQSSTPLDYKRIEIRR